MSIDARFVAGTKKQIADDLRDTPDILAKLYSKRDFARIGHNVDLMARSLLVRGMLSWRAEGDTAAAAADFQAAADLTKELDRSIQSIQEGPPGAPGADLLDIAAFEVPLYACVLASDWKRAQSVAESSRQAFVQDMGDPVKAAMTRLLAAFVLDDKAGFAALRGKYDKLKKSHWWQYFVVYVDLYASVLERDQASFDALMTTAEQRFLARASDRKFGDLRQEYGGGRNNAIVLDFMAVGIAKIARKRGLHTGSDSELVPKALVERG